MTYAPAVLIGLLRCPRNTPGWISISTSLMLALCASANVLTFRCASLMSAIVWGETLEMASWICASDSLNDSGLHLSNFSEYDRTALSPLTRMSSMTPLTIWVTFREDAALSVVVTAGDLRRRATMVN